MTQEKPAKPEDLASLLTSWGEKNLGETDAKSLVTKFNGVDHAATAHRRLREVQMNGVEESKHINGGKISLKTIRRGLKDDESEVSTKFKSKTAEELRRIAEKEGTGEILVSEGFIPPLEKKTKEELKHRKNWEASLRKLHTTEAELDAHFGDNFDGPSAEDKFLAARRELREKEAQKQNIDAVEIKKPIVNKLNTESGTADGEGGEKEKFGTSISIKDGSFRVRPIKQKPEVVMKEDAPAKTEGVEDLDKILADAKGKRLAREKLEAEKVLKEKHPVKSTVIEGTKKIESLQPLMEKLRKDRLLKTKETRRVITPTQPEVVEKPKDTKVRETKPVFEKPKNPLKTQFEVAMERSNRYKEQPIKEKEDPLVYTFNKEDQKDVLEDGPETIELANNIEKANSFEELVAVIEKIEGVQGSQKWFSKNALLGRLHLFQSGEVPAEYLPSVSGLRAKAQELLEKNKSDVKTEEPIKPKKESLRDFVKTSTETEVDEKGILRVKKPDTKTEEVEKSPEPEKINEEEVRKEISLKFEQKLNEALTLLEKPRKEYFLQLAKKLKKDTEKGKLHKLMQSLKMAITQKPNEESEMFSKSKESYDSAIKNLAFCLESVNVEEIVKPLGEKGLTIAQEIKNGLQESLVRQQLVTEKEDVQEIEKSVLPEKDQNIINRMSDLYRRTRKNGRGIMDSLTTE